LTAAPYVNGVRRHADRCTSLVRHRHTAARRRDRVAAVVAVPPRRARTACHRAIARASSAFAGTRPRIRTVCENARRSRRAFFAETRAFLGYGRKIVQFWHGIDPKSMRESHGQAQVAARIDAWLACAAGVVAARRLG
jgi:hypothetical protein